MASTGVVARTLFGEPLRSDRLEETLLPKRLALPVFCSDPLSSVAYATEQILLVLGLGGLALLELTPWVAAAVVLLLVIVVASYRQTCDGLSQRRRRLRRQPRQPRRERVAHRRLGAADRLRADGRGLGRGRRGGDHQRGAGAGAATRWSSRSASSSCSSLVNLRGVKESGRAFAVPTYGFVLCVFAMLAVGVCEDRLRRRPHGRERRATSSGRRPRPAGCRSSSWSCARSPRAARR